MPPKVIVKGEIQQCPVHIQQHVVNFCPVYRFKIGIIAGLVRHVVVVFRHVVASVQ